MQHAASAHLIDDMMTAESMFAGRRLRALRMVTQRWAAAVTATAATAIMLCSWVVTQPIRSVITAM